MTNRSSSTFLIYTQLELSDMTDYSLDAYLERIEAEHDRAVALGASVAEELAAAYEAVRALTVELGRPSITSRAIWQAVDVLEGAETREAAQAEQRLAAALADAQAELDDRRRR